MKTRRGTEAESRVRTRGRNGKGDVKIIDITGSLKVIFFYDPSSGRFENNVTDGENSVRMK